MGASGPKSRFAAQFVTLLQLQTCSCCLLQKESTSKSSYSISVQREKQLKEEPTKFDIGHCVNSAPKTSKFIGQHTVMKRRNVLDGKPRRPVKRPTTSSKIGENFYGRYSPKKLLKSTCNYFGDWKWHFSKASTSVFVIFSAIIYMNTQFE